MTSQRAASMMRLVYTLEIVCGRDVMGAADLRSFNGFGGRWEDGWELPVVG